MLPRLESIDHPISARLLLGESPISVFVTEKLNTIEELKLP